ncbi:MAG TPA: type II toxin-antitoxin system RelE/ParE family toxin [Tepidisphaeraceae bacterium]|nr:type II toxin-antitoxin system RelE/ParE family toxin [Tepidisphaeraceae bacterium]
MRSLPVRGYIIFYRQTREGIELMRVLHGARDLKKIFRRKRR